MDTLETVILTGRSGRCYSFTVLPKGSPLAAVGVVYAVLRDGAIDRFWPRRSVMDMDNQPRPTHPQWTVLYIGQTEDLRARFENAHLDLELARIRATHLAVSGVDAESQRCATEGDLVPRYASLIARPPRPQRKHLVESITIAQRSA